MSFHWHTNSVSSAMHSPDYRFIVSGSDDRTVRLMDFSTGTWAWIGEHDNYVTDVAYSPDQVASCSWDYTIRFWDCKTGACRCIQNAHGDWIMCIKYSPGYERLISGCADGKVKIWDSKTGKNLGVIEAHGKLVNSLDYSPDGTSIASGSWEHTIRIWNSKTYECIMTLWGKSPISCVAYSPDSRNIASVDEDSRINVWDCHTGKQLWSGIISEKGSWGKKVVYSQDGNYIISATWNQRIRIWNSKTGVCICEKAYEDSIIALDQGGKVILSKVIEKRDTPLPIWRTVYSQDIPFFSVQNTMTSLLHGGIFGKLSDPRIWHKIVGFL